MHTRRHEVLVAGDLLRKILNPRRDLIEITDARTAGPFDAGVTERTAIARRRALKLILKIPAMGKQHHATAAEG
jgi:hypothetical protein